MWQYAGMTTKSETEEALLGFNFDTIDHMQPAELDKLPFGAIQLDADGRVKSFNRYEQELSRMSRESVMGRSFLSVIFCETTLLNSL